MFKRGKFNEIDMEELKTIVSAHRKDARELYESSNDFVESSWLVSELLIMNMNSQEELSCLTKGLMFLTIVLVGLTGFLVYYTWILVSIGG